MTTTDPDLGARHEAGLRATREAGLAALRHFERRRDLAIESKGLQDFVSVADREVERLLVDTLSARFPSDAFLGEEHGQAGSGRTCWVIDPIDGTSNFVRGISFWCVSVGLLVDNVPVLGFIHDPVRDELFAARHGHGATCNGRPMRASEAEPSAARVNLGFSFGEEPRRFAETMGGLLARGTEFCRLGSAAMALACVADGRLEGFWQPRIKSWDVCAGLVLAAEAGAVVDDFFAGEGPVRQNACFAAAPRVAPVLRAAIAEAAPFQRA